MKKQQKTLPQHTDWSWSHPHMMETMQRLRSGNASSQHTWAYRTASTQICWQERKGDVELTAAAETPEEAESWIQRANNLKYTLISTTTAAAAIAHRQHQRAKGLEVYRQLCHRVLIPLGTRSIGYHKVAQANLQPQQLWGVVLNMGIRGRAIWARQQHTTSRPGQDSSSHEWDSRPFATASTPEWRTSTNIHNDQRGQRRPLQGFNNRRPQ